MEHQEPNPRYKDINGRIDGKRLLANIWFRPSATLKFILSNCPDKYVLGLIVLGGITRSVSRAFAQNGVHPSDSKIIAAITIGALSGWITTYCYTVALSAVGRLLGGNADSSQFRTVVAWAMVPSIGGLGLLALRYNLLRPDLINPATIAPYWTYIESIISFASILLIFWTVIIFLKGTSILQGFGLAKSFINMLLPGAVILVLIAAFTSFDRLFSSLLQ